MLIHPDFDPVAFSIGSLSVRWYALMYLAGFLVGWRLSYVRLRYDPIGTRAQLNDCAAYLIAGAVIGGRLGYVIFYDPVYYFHHPLDILRPSQGGMSFHGGFVCEVFVTLYLCWKYERSWWRGADFLAPLVPLGLMLGRFGNFINGELWGRVADPALPWAMVFPKAGDALPRHPSQFYHAALEGLALFLILWFLGKKRRPAGTISAAFLIGYAVFRFIVEFFREPDHGISDTFYTAAINHWFTLGIVLLGAALFVLAYRKRTWLILGPTLAILGALLFGYGGFRAIVGLFNTPDTLFSEASALTMGQCLSLPMIGLGCLMLWVIYGGPVPVTSRVRALLDPDFSALKHRKHADLS
jgi:phosphatidylglycerol:prolipoprotein diacylglycerol transferase